MASSSVVIHPLISPMQKIILYKTKARYFLVGSNNTQDRFRVLKIDRMEPKDLNVIDDKVEYSKREIKDLLNMIENGNMTKQGQKFVSDLNRTISSFGIVGFVKFLEGYYLILITKRKRVAIIGHHTIFKIQDTTMVYIPNVEKSLHPHEAKYLKLFQSMDLSSNFYFSYSYDLTHTLQYNMTPVKELSSLNVSQDEDTKPMPFWNPQTITIEGSSEEVAENFNESLEIREKYVSVSNADGSAVFANSANSDDGVWSEMRSNEELSSVTKESNAVHYGVKTKPNWRFVWNSFLFESVDLHSDWLLYITHGFVGQSNVCVYGRPIYLTLIARRSQKFAGTRFLKRGANDKGDVANEVETEQIVFDSYVSSLTAGHFTSFVQLRGSIPSQWSQDISKIVPKPAISLDISDPFYYGAGRHFNDLMSRYGCPLYVLNLVKKREKKQHESILSEEFCETVKYLNQFLPPSQRIVHIGFDMAHFNKLEDSSVMPLLAQIAYYVISKIGLFDNRPEYFSHKINPHKQKNCSLGGRVIENQGRLQTGIVRVNCVDCLDRTNTAQFALGKAALAFQLYSLGVLEKPTLQFDSDCIRMLEELYEIHGDTLALQYGGSQLVHRVQTYRKISPLSSHSRDIMQTLSRYYSNTFSDADKQNAINLFLGIYKPSKSNIPLWEMLSDYYLHNAIAAGEVLCHRNVYTCWLDRDAQMFLPQSFIEANKRIDGSVMEIIKSDPHDQRIDGFFDHYRPFEMTSMTDLLPFSMNHSVRDVMPSFSTDYSPFSVRVRPGRKQENLGEEPLNPSVTGMSSTCSASSVSSDTDSGSDDDFVFMDLGESSSSCSSNPVLMFENFFTSMKQVYGTELKKPSDTDMKIYQRFVDIGKCDVILEQSQTRKRTKSRSSSYDIKANNFVNDSTVSVTPPILKKSDCQIYANYTQKGEKGPSMPSQKSIRAYQSYCASQFQ